MKKMLMVAGMAAALVTMGGGATLDKVYDAQVTWTNAPVVKVVTNTVVVTNVVPQVTDNPAAKMAAQEIAERVKNEESRR
jgi:hypothetical protein